MSLSFMFRPLPPARAPFRPRPAGARTLIRLTILALAACAFASPALANAINVNSTSDALSNADGVCTLREAVINANNDAATWANCAAGSGADVINLPAGVITLAIPNTPHPFTPEQLSARGDIDINSSLTVNGHPSGTTVDGNDLDRIFDINPDPNVDDGVPAPSIVVDINDLTITNGRINDAGGGLQVFPNATVTVDNCTISNNTVTVNDGGGVNNGGTLTMTNTTVSGNETGLLHGGIANLGTMTLVNCTVTRNRTTDGTPTRAQGLGASGTTVLRNTIVAGNGPSVPPASPPDASPDTEGFITSQGYNIIGRIEDQFGNVITTVTPATGDQIGVGGTPVQLGPLQNNGGPTPTHALLAGSIAIDRGHGSGSAADQRGETRPCDDPGVANDPGGDGADVGAFELQTVCAAAPQPPVAVDDTPSVAEDSGPNVLNVLANDTDANGDTLSVTNVTQGAHGAVVNNGTSVTYTPAADFFGPDSFAYTVTDGNGGFDTATVTVNVTNVNDAPAAQDDNYSMSQDTQLNTPAPGVLANDADVDNVSLAAALVSSTTNGLLAFNPDGSFVYQPNPGFTGVDVFTYKADDGAADSAVATVTITVADTQGPSLSSTVTKTTLWSPNHDLVNVGLSVSASDNSGDPVSVQVFVYSDEDDVTPDADDHSADAKDIAPLTLRLRAERTGAGDGRVYLVVVVAADSSHNVSRNYLTVVVPKSKSQGDAASVAQQAQAALQHATANAAPPPSFFLVGDGPAAGPKQ